MPVSRVNHGGDPSAKSPRSKTASSEAPTVRQSGRRHPYHRKYASIAKTMCQLGAAKSDLAQAFEVDQATIEQWQVTYQKFAEACRVGADHANERVEQSVYQRALGYEYQIGRAHV